MMLLLLVGLLGLVALAVGGGDDKMVVYGEAPGWKDAGTEYLNTTRGLLKSGGGPGLSQLQALLPGYTDLWGKGAEWQKNALGPDFLTGQNPALTGLEDIWRQKAEMDTKKRQGNLIMRFGAGGHQLSSPMFNALAEDQRASDLAVGEQVGNAQYQDYATRLAMQEQASGQAMSQTLQALGLTSQEYQQLLSNLVTYMQAGKGQVAGQTEGSDNGLMSGLLSGLLGAATKLIKF